MSPALASDGVVALDSVRRKAIVVDDPASGPQLLEVCPVASLSEALSSAGVLFRSLPSGSAPVGVLDPLAALPKTAPLAAGEVLVSSVALLAIALVPLVLSAALSVATVPWVPPVACPAYSADPMVPMVDEAITPVPAVPPPALLALAPVPLLLVACGWSPEEVGRSCLVRTGEAVALRRALPLSCCPSWFSWAGISISMICLFEPLLLDMLVINKSLYSWKK